MFCSAVFILAKASHNDLYLPGVNRAQWYRVWENQMGCVFGISKNFAVNVAQGENL